MALFKIKRGLAATLPKTYVEGYCYFTTDDGKFYIDTTNTAAGRITLNAYKADILRTARNLQVDLESTSYVSFDGSVDRKNIGVSGVLGVANGGTGKSSWTKGCLIYASNASTLAQIAVGSSGQYLQSTGSAPTWATFTVPSMSYTTAASKGTIAWSGVGGSDTVDIPAATTSIAGLLTSADKTKLNYTNVAYGTCSTAADTAEKVITVTGNTNWALTAGSIITILFSNTNTAQSPTFNINGTGAKKVYYLNTQVTTSNLNYGGYKNRPMVFMYDGTQFHFISWGYESGNTNTQVRVYRQTTGYNADYPILVSRTATTDIATVGTNNSYEAVYAVIGQDGAYTPTINPYTGAIKATSFTGDGSALTKINASNISSGTLAAACLPNSGATAGSYGPSATVAPGSAGTFNVPYVTVTEKGIVSAISSKTITMPTIGNATITIKAGTGLATGGSFTTNQTSASTITLNHSNSVTAGTVSDGGSTRTLAFGGTFKIPSITYDAQGHITGTSTITLTMPANPNTDTHYTANLLLGASGATSTSTSAVSNPYIILRENGTNRNQIQVKAGSNVTVSGDDGIITISSSYTNTTYSQATSSTLGLVKIGYTASGKNYPVQLNTSGQMYVNVPWTDSNTTYTFTNKAATLSWGTAVTIATVGGTDITVKLPSNPNTDTNTAHDHEAGNGITLTGTGGISGKTTIALSNSFTVTGTITASKVVGAVWNDYAEYRWVLKNPDNDEPIEAGRCVAENGNDSMSLTHDRLQAGARIISDTYGMCMGETEKAKTPIAVCGRVLAYPFERKVAFNVGDAVCSGPNGTVSKMSREEIMMYPERIVGTVVSKPTYKEWGPNKIPVKGRIWIQVR